MTRAALCGCAAALALVAACSAVTGIPTTIVVVPPAPTSTATEEAEAAPEADSPTALRGARIRIVHIAERTSDAQEVARRLRQLGATVVLSQTSDAGNEDHLGHLYVDADFKRFTPAILRAASRFERLQPVVSASSRHDDGYFNLWIARPRGSK